MEMKTDILDGSLRKLLEEHRDLNKERVKILARMKEIEDELRHFHSRKLENG